MYYEIHGDGDGTPLVNQKAQVFITAAETESATMCEVCGKPGQQGFLEKTTWVVVRCQEHEK